MHEPQPLLLASCRWAEVAVRRGLGFIEVTEPMQACAGNAIRRQKAELYLAADVEPPIGGLGGVAQGQ